MTKATNDLWWKKGVIYQIYPRSFMDSNRDGIGDLLGIVQRLDYLGETLGVDAIWLSPFYPSPQADFGYDVSNYCAVDPQFGNLDDFDHLVTEAHKRNIQFVIDFVPNHTSEEHPWFLESRATRDNPKRDWYVWRDPRPDGALPNNWQSVFGGTGWEWDETTRQYYFHSFLKEQPDLNWRNPRVKAAMFGAVRFWLERGVDGFRLDVAHYIMKDPGLRDNPVNPKFVPNPNSPSDTYGSTLHPYDKGHPDVHQVFREFRGMLNEFEAVRPRYSVGEIHIFDWKEWAGYYGQLDELHMPFNFSLMLSPFEAKVIRGVVDALEAAIPQGAWPNYVMNNHDTPRIVSRIGPEKARLSAMLLLTLRGTPTLYMGEELGMTQLDVPPERQKDPFGRRVPGRGRDGCRTPFQWNADLHAGFSDPSVAETWLPVSPDYKTLNVESELKEPTSFLNLYRKLLALRRAMPALQLGNYQPLDGVPDDCYVYLRQADDDSVLVALNISEKPRSLSLARLGYGNLRISTCMDKEGVVDLAKLVLRPYEGVVIELK